MSIQEHLNKIRNAVYGREVRESIAKGIETAYDDASEKDNANMEVKIARGTHPNLRSRLEEVDNKQQQTTAQLAQKVGHGENEAITKAMLASDIKEELNGGEISFKLNTSEIEDGAITLEKTNFAKEITLNAKNLIKNGNFAVDSDGDGWADEFAQSGVNHSARRVENNTQYWMPLSTFSSGGARTSVTNQFNALANHKYYLSVKTNNVRVFLHAGNDNAYYPSIDSDRYSTIIEYNEDTFGNLTFLVREAEVEASISNLLIVDLTETFGAGNEPDIAYFEYLLDRRGNPLWFDNLNLVDVSEKPLLSARDLDIYDPNQTLPASNANDAILDMYNKVIEMENRLGDLGDVGEGGEYEYADRQFVSLTNAGNEHKLILHLHKREKEDGFGEYNNAYVPNANDDLSDVRIMTDKGKFLPTKTIYQADDFDIVPYDWTFEANQNSVTRQDSYGALYQSQAYMRKSEDKGHTWVNIPAFEHMHNPQLNIIDENDVMYFNHDSKLYRSEYPYNDYQMVFDLDPENLYPDVRIDSKGLVKHPDGELFCGLYQTPFHIRFYKSVDDGLSWQLSADFGDVYQHIHGMYIDVYANPPAVYAGADINGGVYKTTDKGATWVDLRALYPEMPQATDYGVRYADPSGYRLLGGETAVVGGHSIIKTTDDKTFRPVLSDGTSVNEVVKNGERMFATGSGGHSHRNGAIYISRNNAKTWESVYRTSVITDLWSANDGYRYMTQISDNEVFVGSQSKSRPPLLLTFDGSYAEVVVDVPEDAEYLIVESGHRKRRESTVVNDVDFVGEKLVHFELNENRTSIQELVSGQTFTDSFKWTEVGRKLSYFYPPVVAPEDRYSVMTNSLKGYDLNLPGIDTTDGFTISFWLKRSGSGQFILMQSASGDTLEIKAGYQLHLNGRNIVSYGGADLPGTIVKYDIVFDGNGGGAYYNNGLPMSPSYVRDYEELSAMMSAGGVTTFLKNVSTNDNFAMQHFIIRKGMIDEKQLLDEYNGLVKDNIDE